MNPSMYVICMYIKKEEMKFTSTLINTATVAVSIREGENQVQIGREKNTLTAKIWAATILAATVWLLCQ